MPELSENERNSRAAQIELLVLDVDGVLTSGDVTYVDERGDIKSFHVRDGSAIKWWREAGWGVAIISGRTSPTLARRANELGITRLVQGADAKLTALQRILGETGIHPERVCAMGDDLPDLPVMRNVGLAIAVADAASEVRKDAHYVTRAAGGRGAVREAIEMLLQAQGRWSAVVESFRTQRL